jgi:hypothetical protein
MPGEPERLAAELAAELSDTRRKLAAAEQRADLAEREVERLRKHVCADGHHPTFLRGTCIRCGVGAKETP